MQFFQMWQKVNLLRAFFPLLTHKMPDIEREKGRGGEREGERLGERLSLLSKLALSQLSINQCDSTRLDSNVVSGVINLMFAR